MQQQLILDIYKSDHKLIFVDETGAHGFDFTKPDTLRYLIVTGIVIAPDEFDEINEKIQYIRDEYMGGKEIKSSDIGKDDITRIKILQQVDNLKFYIFPYIIDKQKIPIDSPLTYKQTFYKHAHSLLHKELRNNYMTFDLFADEIGTKEYMKSFSEYFLANNKYRPSLSFQFLNSKDSNLIQLVDLVCGTLGQIYNFPELSNKNKVFMRYLNDKLLVTGIFPRDYKSYIVDIEQIKSKGFDKIVASHCLKKIVDFVNAQKKEKDELVHAEYVLEMLLNSLQFNINKGFINASTLIKRVNKRFNTNYNRQLFSRDIIGMLRDEGIIISSGKQGYKIPVNMEEVYMYTNHTMHVIIPMLDRLKKCRESLLIETDKKYDLLETDEYEEFKVFFDEIYKKNLN